MTTVTVHEHHAPPTELKRVDPEKLTAHLKRLAEGVAGLADTKSKGLDLTELIIFLGISGEVDLPLVGSAEAEASIKMTFKKP